jgi:amidase
MRAGEALSCWARYSFTRALRAVDPARVLAEAAVAPPGPLAGLLCSVKDLFPVAGVESCAGSLLLAGCVPAADPPLVARLRAAGAVVFGKGVCAEFGFGVDTENRLDGRVTHFRDPSLSPGGSSGGDAVAVGAGIADFAVAGDYGGSVRWPAQAAGVYGMRLGVAHPLAGAAATGRIGLRPACASQQASLETAGILARSPRMLRAVLAALADGTDEVEAPVRSVSSSAAKADQPGTGRRSPRRPRERRLVISDGTEVAPVLPRVAAAVAAARAAAARAGYDLVPAPAVLRGALAEAAGVYAALRAATDDHQPVRELAAGKEELLCGSTRAVLDEAMERAVAAGSHQVRGLRARAAEIRACVRAELSAAGASALLLPVAASGPIGFGARVAVEGRMLDATALMAHCRAVSLTGLPALAMPVPGGLSVQLVGLDRGEETLCGLAAGLAAAS